MQVISNSIVEIMRCTLNRVGSSSWASIENNRYVLFRVEWTVLGNEQIQGLELDGYGMEEYGRVRFGPRGSCHA